MSSRAKNVAITLGAVVVVAAIVWLDLSTAIWSEVVILSGLAAGLVTFLLTVFVLDKVLARATARKWSPVNRLALTEFLHAIADEEHSEISRGIIVPRTLPHINRTGGGPGGDTTELDALLDALRAQVVDERAKLTKILSRWAQFLASSGENEQILLHVADIALQLDAVRDATLEIESHHTESTFTELDARTRVCNATMLKLEAELQSRIAADERL